MQSAACKRDGSEGVEVSAVECRRAFSGAMVEISSLGPKSKPKLKLVSKSLFASFAKTAADGLFGIDREIE